MRVTRYFLLSGPSPSHGSRGSLREVSWVSTLSRINLICSRSARAAVIAAQGEEESSEALVEAGNELGHLVGIRLLTK